MSFATAREAAAQIPAPPVVSQVASLPPSARLGLLCVVLLVAPWLCVEEVRQKQDLHRAQPDAACAERRRQLTAWIQHGLPGAKVAPLPTDALPAPRQARHSARGFSNRRRNALKQVLKVVSDLLQWQAAAVQQGELIPQLVLRHLLGLSG